MIYDWGHFSSHKCLFAIVLVKYNHNFNKFEIFFFSDWLAIRRVSPSLRKRRSLESMGHVTKLIQHLMKELDQQKTAVSDIMSKMVNVENTVKLINATHSF